MVGVVKRRGGGGGGGGGDSHDYNHLVSEVVWYSTTAYNMSVQQLMVSIISLLSVNATQAKQCIHTHPPSSHTRSWNMVYQLVLLRLSREITAHLPNPYIHDVVIMLFDNSLL